MCAAYNPFNFGSYDTPTTDSTIGTTIKKFKALTGTDASSRRFLKVRLQCITLMNEYKERSLEELRLEDYTANRKFPSFGGQLIPMFNTHTNAFNATASTSGTSNTKFIAQPGNDVTLGRIVNTRHHCITEMDEYKNKSFEELRMEDYTLNPFPLSFSFGGPPKAMFDSETNSTNTTPINGTTMVKFIAPCGTDVSLGCNVNTKLQCITVMDEYKEKSLEELRLEDYTANPFPLTFSFGGPPVALSDTVANTPKPSPFGDSLSITLHFGKPLQPNLFGSTGSGSTPKPGIFGNALCFNFGGDGPIKFHNALSGITISSPKSGRFGSILGFAFGEPLKLPNTTCDPTTKLAAKAKENNSDLLCKICMDKELGVVFLPCGHLASCAECAQFIFNCPICRKDITGSVKTYLS